MLRRHGWWLVAAGLSSVCLLFIVRQRRRLRLHRPRKKAENKINIGAVFGMDVGDTLTKLVYFERQTIATKDDDAAAPKPSPLKRSRSLEQLNSPEHVQAMEELYSFVMASKTYGKTGVRDEHLMFYSPLLQGRFHFIRFETSLMPSVIELVSNSTIHHNIKTIGCTGGGAYKYSSEFSDQLDINVIKMDEMDCLMRGLHFIVTNVVGECYTYRPEDEDNEGDRSTRKAYTRKVHLPNEEFRSEENFPYLVVNIGSGVSMLKVEAPGKWSRVSGSTIGGGTFWGLCRLLTKAKTYDEVLDMSEHGDSSQVDMLVGDIYGRDYDRFQLSADTVASSFGKTVSRSNPREGTADGDIIRALLMMITNNIGQVAYLNAQVHGTSRIFFIGNFLRQNAISCRRLSFAIDYWSGGKMEALFLEHEGYFGAVGAFLQSAFREDCDSILSWGMKPKSKDMSTPKPTIPQTVLQARSSDDLMINRRRSGTSIKVPNTMRADLPSRRRAFTFDQFVDITPDDSSNGSVNDITW